MRTGWWSFLCLVGGGAVVAAIFSLEAFFNVRNSDMVDILVLAAPVYVGLALLGLYGILYLLFVRDSTRAVTQTESALVGEGMRHTPVVVLALFAVLLIPLAVPFIRNTSRPFRFAAKAMVFWVLPLAVVTGYVASEKMGSSRRYAAQNAAATAFYRSEFGPPAERCARCRVATEMAAAYERQYGVPFTDDRHRCPRVCGTSP